jgi:hypothetical protein
VALVALGHTTIQLLQHEQVVLLVVELLAVTRTPLREHLVKDLLVETPSQLGIQVVAVVLVALVLTVVETHLVVLEKLVLFLVQLTGLVAVVVVQATPKVAVLVVVVAAAVAVVGAREALDLETLKV